MTREEMAELWRSRISDYRASGERVATWCERHQVTPHQLWYWMRKLKAEQQSPSASRPQWVPVRLAETASDTDAPALRVKIGAATIEVRPGFEPTLFAAVVRTLKTLC